MHPPVLLFVLLTLSACTAHEDRFRDLVEVDTIDAVVLHNNRGDYRLTREELRRFKGVLGDMWYRPQADLKMGTIGFSLYIQGQQYEAVSRTHGRYLSVPHQLVPPAKQHLLARPSSQADAPLIFEFDSAVNLDNYHARR
ncbi:hypothetical protein [Hymenobacter sp. GOD-10R]|uniref:hypothetical protein n=1 Tax=Hymenobacter sp. GOD-10R TaxID=3093922 RepID=UPI002D781F43|nr:hypothetical protein [Hymenobacter sp. GOD-10R]WRQ31632.1 hypothetical protein SD425_27760 [Hymenobacter sp. GOD-10R]